ncbi:MAG TPA: flagellar protein FlaG [Steroidobacteraceae bacterium]
MAEESEDIGSIDAIGAADGVSSSDSPPAAAPARASTAPELQAAVNRVNARLSSYHRVLELSVDAASGLTIATVRDSQSGAVLQQFPGANALHLAEMLAKWAGGRNALLDLIA